MKGNTIDQSDPQEPGPTPNSFHSDRLVRVLIANRVDHAILLLLSKPIARARNGSRFAPATTGISDVAKLLFEHAARFADQTMSRQCDSLVNQERSVKGIARQPRCLVALQVQDVSNSS